jgi:outer membrane protein assembly factor BamB
MCKYYRVCLSSYIALAYLALCLAPAPPASAVVLNQRFKLTASDGLANDRLGSSVAIGADSVVVFGDFDNDTAYVYDLATGNERFKLPIPNANRSSWFQGSSVAASGNTAVVTGGRADEVAYVFDLATGNQRFTLTPDISIPLMRFGASVAASGDLAVVGALGDGVSNANLGGSAYIFDTTTGNQLHRLTADDASAEAFFGSSVAMDGNLALIGAPRSNSGDPGLGSAYVFDLTTGNQLFKLTGSNVQAGDDFGRSVAISGNIAVVGTLSDAAYVFDVTTGQELFKLTASDAAPGFLEFFGFAVTISGDTAIIGSHGKDLGSGAAYVFDVTTGSELAKLTVPDAPAGALSFSVALNGTTAVIGARNDTIGGEFRSGSAYVFDLVPEPTSVSLLALGGYVLFRARDSRRRD